MKKIICGKLYNTASATCVGSDEYSYPGQLHYWCEDLYRKKNGEYFLYCEGGPASRYARFTGPNERSGGETIVPMSVDEAKNWVEEHLDVEKFIEEFGEPEE
jgi:hypothetical protein